MQPQPAVRQGSNGRPTHRAPPAPAQWGPLAVEWVSALALQHLPAAWADAAVDLACAASFGGPGWQAAAGLRPPAAAGREWRPYAAGRVPVVDKWAGAGGDPRYEGGLVACLRRRRIRVVGPLVAARPGAVVAAGDAAPERGAAAEWGSAAAAAGGEVVPCDVVILATGWVARWREKRKARGRL